MKPSPALSIVGKAKANLEGRKVGILFAEGSDRAEIDKVGRPRSRPRGHGDADRPEDRRASR